VTDNKRVDLTTRDRKALLFFGAVLWAICLIGGIVGGKPVEGFLLGPVIGTALFAGFFILFAAINLPAIIHEFGHYLAGRAVNFRFFAVIVWPFALIPLQGRYRLKLLFNSHQGAAMIWMEPEDSDRVVERHRLMVLGGPLANLLSLPCFLLLDRLVLPKPTAVDWRAFVVWTNQYQIALTVVFLVMSIVPYRSKKQRNDGMYVWMSYKRPHELRKVVLYSALIRCLQRGQRAREWDSEMFAAAVDESTPDVSRAYQLLLAYYRALDSGMTREAVQHIVAAVNALTDQPIDQPCAALVHLEAAYAVALVDGDSERAREQIKLAARCKPTADFVALRALAAVHLASGEWTEAIELAHQANESLAAKAVVWTPSADAEKEWIDDVADRAAKASAGK
jgi:hypothetical protein